MKLNSDGKEQVNSIIKRIEQDEESWEEGRMDGMDVWDLVDDCRRVFRYLLKQEEQPMTEEEKIIQQLTNLSSAAIHTGNAIEAIQTLMESHRTRIHALEKAYTKLYMGLEKLIEPTEAKN